jgi:hypothetical protein
MGLLFHERVKINKTAQVNVSRRGVIELVRRCHGEQSRPLRVPIIPGLWLRVGKWRQRHDQRSA